MGSDCFHRSTKSERGKTKRLATILNRYWNLVEELGREMTGPEQPSDCQEEER